LDVIVPEPVAVVDGDTDAQPPIRRAVPGDAGVLGRLIADEFHHLEVAAWLVADPLERRIAMGGHFEIVVGHAIAHGDVYVVDGPDGATGVAVWFPESEIPDIDDYDERLAVACGTHTVRFARLDDVFHSARPAEPHAYLALLAVRASVRSGGVGSALLRAHHARLDATGTDAYLDASNLRSRKLYLRHGYADRGAPYGITGGDDFYPMWRAAA
jgi:ribosomal protein S18 acetylase RimI-like enzyme